MSPDPVSSPTVYVTLDQSLGQLRRDPGRAAQPIVGMDLHPSAAASLRELGDLGVAVDLLLPEVDDPAVAAAVSRALPGTITARTQAELSAAAGLAGAEAGAATGYFVAADRVRRQEAARLGLTPLPHVALVAPALRDEALSFVQITGGRPDLERLPDLLPYHLERQPDGQWTCLAVVPQGTLAQAVVRRLRVDVLPLNIGSEDPLFVQLDNAGLNDATAFAALRILAADGLRALVAMPADLPIDEIPFHGAHGHFEHLAPSPDLLRPAPPLETPALVARWAASFPANGTPVEVVAVNGNGAAAISALGPLTCSGSAASFAADVGRLSGVTDPGGGRIRSRHVRHPHNPRAVDFLLAELAGMGYCSYTHAFQHEGRTLHNVIADLPGKGMVQLVPDLREQVRTRLLADGMSPERNGSPAWLAGVAELIDLDSLAGSGDDDPARLRQAVERAAGLSPWQAWWLADCPLPGPGAELVIVGCHLDSTAQSNIGFDPANDPAPGADDDASGVAGVLAVARHLAERQGALTHTIRFGFFNAEEHGLVGSKAYAQAMKAAGAPIRAVVCMDMIGFNSDPNRLFEIHAGFTNPVVRDASVPIANRVAAWASSLGMLAPAQVYRGTMQVGGVDRDLFDGAINRSDHAAFHQQGYPAVVVTEDFFANLPSEPSADPNPHYHQQGDTVIDAAFAADIVCAVTHAVTELAS